MHPEIARARRLEAQVDRLPIKDSGHILRVPMDDILWIDAAGGYMCVHTCQDTHVQRATMRELEGKLDPRRFQRIRRSTIVNVARACASCARI